MGLKINGKWFSSSLTMNGNFLNTDFSGGNIKTAFGCSIYDFRPQITAGIYFSPDSKNNHWEFSEKIGLKIEYAGFPNCSINNTFSISEKKKITFTSSLNAKVQFRFCSLRVHLEFQV